MYENDDDYAQNLRTRVTHSSVYNDDSDAEYDNDDVLYRTLELR